MHNFKVKENEIIKPSICGGYFFILALYIIFMICYFVISPVSAVSMNEIKLSNLESVNNYFTNITNNTFYNSTVNESYILKDGIAGGQTLIGGTSDFDSLILNSTASPNRGSIKIMDSVLRFYNKSGNLNGYIDGTTYGSDFSLFKDGISQIRFTSVPSASSYILNNSLGIGTISPSSPIEISGGGFIYEKITSLSNEIAGLRLQLGTTSDANTDWYIRNDYGGFSLYSTTSGSGAYRLYITSDGKLSIGSNVNPSSPLDVTGAVRFRNFGAGTATFDAGGNISSVSDEKLKKNKHNYSSSAPLPQPIQFNYNEQSGLDTNNIYTGFSAQNVQNFYPECVFSKPDVIYETVCDGEDDCHTIEVSQGSQTLSVDDRCLLAAAFNTINRQQAVIDRICIKGNPSLCEV